MAVKFHLLPHRLTNWIRIHVRSCSLFISREDGSISVLTIGLFTISVALLILITDVASISVSKQSLVHVTEAAAIRAVHSVDLGSYYRGDSGVPVPIDCQQAYQVIADEMNLWLRGEGDIRRRELQEVSLTDFSCSGDGVEISTSARTLLPFRLPQGSAQVEIHATVKARSERVP